MRMDERFGQHTSRAAVGQGTVPPGSAGPWRQSVLLQHLTRHGSHFDWMFEAPGHVDADRLVSFRVDRPLHAWAGRKRVFERIADHRRAYLLRQGAISGGRGRVRRVDRGRCRVRLFTVGRIVVELRMGGVAGQAHLTRLSGDRWAGILLRARQPG